MAQIIRAEIVGIREAENTRIGLTANTTINSTSYSVLVFYSDGTRNLVEGSLQDISYLLNYMEPSGNIPQIEKMLEKHESVMKNEIQTLVQEEVQRVFDSIHPIPEVCGKKEDIAIKELQEKGFKIELINNYPPDIPPGVVYGYNRKHGTYMTVQLDVRHDLPDVSNLSIDQAISTLTENGFITSIIEKIIVDDYSKPLFTVSRDGNTMNVAIIVNKAIPALEGATIEEAESILLENNISLYGIKNKYSDVIPIDEVIKAEIIDDKGVVLFVSLGKERYECNNLSCSVSKLKDSSSCSIHGSAKYNINQNKIEL